MDREMWVAIDGSSSPPTRVLSGVPQGKVLGPLLFLIYINDLPRQVSPGTVICLFADDCLVYREVRSPEDQLILQRDMEALHQWAEKWGMRFNAKKCYVMCISRGPALSKMYNLAGEVLQNVESAKYMYLPR